MTESHAELALSPAMAGECEVNGHRLYWERYGPGEAPAEVGSAVHLEAPTVLLLHHGLGSIRSWRRQIPPLVECGWQVLAYDRWGYGRSDERPTFQSGFLEDDMHECSQLLAALGIDRCAVIGHSDGGSIALMLAAAEPARVTKLVCVAAHIYVEPKMEASMPLIERQSQTDPVRRVLVREHGSRAQRLTRMWIEHWSRSDPAELSLLPLLPAVKCPTLVIQGELDEHATDQHARDIAEAVPQAELWLIPNVGHMPIHEVPEAFNQRVLEFLGQPL